ncbi:MAG: glycosyltransferase family 4 protein, partial [Sphingomonas sp.]|uniref:glycosyltransferase family 4 protein n=1 Tax=Sphingomonas sp. TaxID=28214 RepID=UPI00258E14EE
EPYKGIAEFLELARRLPELHFVIAGDGSAAQQVRESAEILGNVKFCGPLRDAALLEAIDGAMCVVVPSLWPEAFGLTAVEAQARGVPVVASRIGGMTETVRDGIDGVLVPPGDVDALAEGVRAIAEDPDRAATMGKAAMAKVREHYGPDRYYERIMEVYRFAMERN